GDLLNLTGAILQHLLRHIIILGVYYTVTDTVLIFQIYYYRKFNKSDEELPLLQTQPNKNKNKNDKNSTQLQFIIVIPILLLCVLTGVVAFSNRQEVKKDHSLWIRKEQMELLPQMFGWISAFLYLGSRIPQILQNYKSKSTEGLSLA
ncbi:15110_t:CDS:2, partial [Funneliformis caledonium]